MPRPRKFEPRSKDVLLALSAAFEHGQRLGRLPLQKLIYLFDVLAIAWRAVAAAAAFRPWYNGPYDSDIQNAVDALAFRGFVEITNLQFRQTRNTECVYKLTAVGEKCVSRLIEQRSVADDLLLFQEICREVDRRGWDQIKEIVYSEPTYLTARAKQQGGVLSLNEPESNHSWHLLRHVRQSYEVGRKEPMSRRTLVQLLFAILDEYRMTPEGDETEPL